jgi:hypothetical protein
MQGVVRSGKDGDLGWKKSLAAAAIHVSCISTAQLLTFDL